MRAPIRTTLAAAVAVLLVAGTARADFWSSGPNCGGSTFNMCASVNVTTQSLGTQTFNGNTYTDVHSVRIDIWNLYLQQSDSPNWIFSTIGLRNVGNVAVIQDGGLGMGGPVRSGDTPSDWVFGQSNSAGGNIVLDLAANSGDGVDNGIASACGTNLPGGSTNLWMNDCVTTLGSFGPSVFLEFYVQGAPNLTDPGLYVWAQNGGPDGDWSDYCVTGSNCNVVPEPITAILLGSGLAGVGAAALRRRRREDEVEDGEETATV